MKIVVDSNRYTDLCRGVPEVVEVIEDATEIHVPLIVLAEQQAGFAHGKNREKNECVLTRFLNNAGVFVLAPDEQTTFFYADAYAYACLRKKGEAIPRTISGSRRSSSSTSSSSSIATRTSITCLSSHG